MEMEPNRRLNKGRRVTGNLDSQKRNRFLSKGGMGGGSHNNSISVKELVKECRRVVKTVEA